MMIVTYEMSFVWEIANRVFYMDEGGSYDEGTPDQLCFPASPFAPADEDNGLPLKLVETQQSI